MIACGEKDPARFFWLVWFMWSLGLSIIIQRITSNLDL
jgi:hypothetical protein